MSENAVVLSNDLNVITAEIKILEQRMKQAMIEYAWEIGRRLVHVKEELKHGNFGQWIEDNFEFTWQYANQFMLYYKRYPNYKSISNLPSWTHVIQTLYLPESIDLEDFVSQKHTIPSTGEQKTVDEMTVRELREVKAALKKAEAEKVAAEERARQAQQSAERAIELKAKLEIECDVAKKHAEELARELEKEKSKPAEVVEKVVEKEIHIVPDEIRARMAELQRQLRQKEKEYQYLKEQMDELLENQRSAEKNFGSLEFAARVGDFCELVRQFMERASNYTYLSRRVSEMSEMTYEGYNLAVSQLEDLAHDLRANIEAARNSTTITVDQGGKLIEVRPNTKILTDDEVEVC